MNAASGQGKPAANATKQQCEGTTAGPTANAVALGAFVRAASSRPHGMDALGTWFLEHHSRSLAEAFGTVLVRLAQLERKAADR